MEKKAMNSEKEMVHKIEAEGDRARCILDQARQKFYEIEDILQEVKHLLKQAKKHRDRAEDTPSDCEKIEQNVDLETKKQAEELLEQANENCDLLNTKYEKVRHKYKDAQRFYDDCKTAEFLCSKGKSLHEKLEDERCFEYVLRLLQLIVQDEKRACDEIQKIYDDVRKEWPHSVVRLHKQDLNKASSEEIENVYGIGPTLTTDITEKRTSKNGFSDWDEVREIPNVGPERVKFLQKHFYLIKPKQSLTLLYLQNKYFF